MESVGLKQALVFLCEIVIALAMQIKIVIKSNPRGDDRISKRALATHTHLFMNIPNVACHVRPKTTNSLKWRLHAKANMSI